MPKFSVNSLALWAIDPPLAPSHAWRGIRANGTPDGAVLLERLLLAAVC